MACTKKEICIKDPCTTLGCTTTGKNIIVIEADKLVANKKYDAMNKIKDIKKEILLSKYDKLDCELCVTTNVKGCQSPPNVCCGKEKSTISKILSLF